MLILIRKNTRIFVYTDSLPRQYLHYREFYVCNIAWNVSQLVNYSQCQLNGEWLCTRDDCIFSTPYEMWKTMFDSEIPRFRQRTYRFTVAPVHNIRSSFVQWIMKDYFFISKWTVHNLSNSSLQRFRLIS